MISLPPKIGFDRFIELRWADTAIRIRAGLASMDELSDILDASHRGEEAKKKTKTVLNRLWLEPRPELVEFADRGIEIFKTEHKPSIPALTWGMAIATYPFFGRVAEIVGRLTALHGFCSSAEVHRRMAEAYGDREGTKRMTNMVLQSQASWGGIIRSNRCQKIERRGSSTELNQTKIVSWLSEACLRYAGQNLSVTTVASHPALFPFTFEKSISYLLSKSEQINLSVDSMGEQIASLNS